MQGVCQGQDSYKVAAPTRPQERGSHLCDVLRVCERAGTKVCADKEYLADVLQKVRVVLTATNGAQVCYGGLEQRQSDQEE